MRLFFTILTILYFSTSFGQQKTKRILFLGNSYTYYNDLPKMLADVASSMGDSIIFDSNTPGGYTLKEHTTNIISLNKIGVGNWDYVILQEQSQLPALPISQVNSDVFPYARILDSIINKKNICAETIFYMTWGRKNGDGSNCSSWPPVCTYKGMDSLLAIRYKTMADTNNAFLSPVGAVWKKIKQNFPLLELYQSDESHPVEAGTYIAACCFYTITFRKNPMLISFNASLSAIDAANIKMAVKQIVYDSLIKYNVGKYDAKAAFTYTSSNENIFAFTNTSKNADTYFWNFGDGATSILENPIHKFVNAGNFSVKLTASKCDKKDSIIQVLNVVNFLVSIEDSLSIKIFPNPVKSMLTINKKNLTNITYKIINSLGKIIKTGIINNTSKQIDVSTIANGIYFLQLFDGNQSMVNKKFVKQS